MFWVIVSIAAAAPANTQAQPNAPRSTHERPISRNTSPIPPPELTSLKMLDETPYAVSYVLDGALTAGAFALVGVIELAIRPELPNARRCRVLTSQDRCATNGLDALDQLGLFQRSEEWRRASDAVLGVAVLGAVSGIVIDALLSDSSTVARDMLADMLVLAEVIGVVLLTTMSLKVAVQRDRPYQYDPLQPTDEGGDGYMGFPSGHTSVTAAGAFGFATNFWLRHPTSPWRWWAGVGALAATIMVGYARVAGGRHFPSDVMVGGVIGASGGIVIPLVHAWLKNGWADQP